MKAIGTAIAAVLFCCAAAMAAEPVHAPAPAAPGTALVAAGTVPPAAVPDAGCGSSCATCASCGHGCGGGRLWAWLTYRPLHRMRCGECTSCCEGRWVPLYLYFLGQCKEHPCTACGACGNCGCSTCGGWSGHGPFGSPTGLGVLGE
jgi:hypothetical protein